MMKLEQLQYFVTAAKYEHIGRAAKTIPISPSAISHSISALEEEIGRDLFIKRGKRIYLTPHGKFLMERAKIILQDVEALREELRSDKVQMTGHYKMAATHLLCANYLMPSWSEIQSEHPQLSIEMYTLRSSQVVAGVIAGEYDLGLCFNPQSHPDIMFKVVHRGQLRIALRKEHPIFRKKREARFAELSQLGAVLPKAFQGVEVCERHPMFEKFRIRVNPDCLMDSYEVAAAKVAMTQSWGFFPDWIIENEPRLKALTLPEGWDAPYQVCGIWSKNRLLTEPLRRLLENLPRRFSPAGKPSKRT
jgi:DNA-binding transcriptional LysR family regulator